MPRPSQATEEQADTAGLSSLRPWLGSLMLVILGVVYISSFWGLAASYLPEPLNRWSYLHLRYAEPWWSRHVPDNWPAVYRRAMLAVVASVVLGMVVPGIVLKLAGYRWRDLGLGAPNALGRRLIAVSAIVAIPFGFWLFWSMHGIRVSFAAFLQYLCGLVAIIPEHFLICGVYVAILLPERKLPASGPMAPIEGTVWLRALRWLGLAQPRSALSDNAIVAWLGLTRSQLAAILASGGLFWMVHFGKPPLELVLSFPGGVAVAYVTLRSHSIWPAVVAHYILNAAAVLAFCASRWTG